MFVNREETQESRGVTLQQLEYPISDEMQLVVQAYENGVLPHGAISLVQLSKWYKTHYPDRGVFELMRSGDPHMYMAYNDQKAYNKAYFVPYLHIIEQGALEAGKDFLLKDIRWNIQDETGIKQEVARNDREDVYPLCPIGAKISDYYPIYEAEAHAMRRKDAMEGKRKLYFARCAEHGVPTYGYRHRDVRDEVLFGGTILHMYYTQQGLHTRNWRNILGRIYFLEHTIPLEFTQSLRWGKRLFPKIDKKTTHYEADHIIHDAGAHAKWLDEAILASNFSEIEQQDIKLGMYEMYLIRAMFYQGYYEICSSVTKK